MNYDGKTNDGWWWWQDGMRATEREMPEVDERAVTKYGSQRLVNNGALRRRGTSSTATTSTSTRPRFTNTLRTLEPGNSGSWQWNHWHSFANILSGSSFIHVDLSYPSFRRFEAQGDGERGERSNGERRRKREREGSESTSYISIEIFSLVTAFSSSSYPRNFISVGQQYRWHFWHGSDIAWG